MKKQNHQTLNPRRASRLPLATIGVLADTHIPDRVHSLHPKIVPTFNAYSVTHILHAGDICSQRVLTELQKVAPVSAVRGNRDWFVPGIPHMIELKLANISIALMHGHGNLIRYLLDKIQYYKDGYQLRRYLKLLALAPSDSQVVIFGHTHYPEVIWQDGRLLFNPGSASFGPLANHLPSIGIIQIFENGEIHPHIKFLKGFKVSKGRWISRKNHQIT